MLVVDLLHTVHDFKDLLQVRLRNQYLKDCCQSHITQLSWCSCIKQQNGMHLQNFGYILRVLYITLTDLQQCLGSQCDNLEMPLILLLQLLSFQNKQEHNKGTKSLVKGRKKQVEVLLQGKNPDASPTSGTCLEIIHLFGATDGFSTQLVSNICSFILILPSISRESLLIK